jgi:hypothetical protein
MQIFLSPKDIIGIRFECHGCHERINVRFPSDSKFLEEFLCPHCHQQWFQGNFDTRLGTIRSFLNSFKDLRIKEFEFDISFEIASPDDLQASSREEV